jgi:uncharacterized membrane protein YtjA (UPF0391 family)
MNFRLFLPLQCPIEAARGTQFEPEALARRFRGVLQETNAMSLLKWALIMLVVSLLAALFGFTDLAAASADVARVLFYIFLVIFLVLLVMGLMGARAARGP